MHYFKGKISHSFITLYIGKIIIMSAIGLAGLFLPIFLFEIFKFNINYVISYYLAGYLLYGLLVAYGVRILNKIGFARSLRLSIFFGALFYFIFYFLFINKENSIILIALSVVVLVLFRIFYWTPYRTDLAKFTNEKNRAKELSLLKGTNKLILIIMPIIAGFIISHFNYGVLFIITILLYLLSGIPYLTLPRTREKFSWGYFQTWRKFFSEKRKKIILAYMADGGENVIGVVIWPIFIWQLLHGNYFKVGALSTLIMGVAIILQLLTGEYMDKFSREKLLHWGSVFYALGCIAKIFIITTFQIFIVSSYHTLARIFLKTPFDTLTYELAADQGHYVDEFTVLHEIAINLGRSAMCILLLVFLLFFNIQWTFILAALTSLLFNLLHSDKEVANIMLRV